MRAPRRFVLPACTLALAAGAVALGGGDPQAGDASAPGPQGGSLATVSLSSNLNGRREIDVTTGANRAGDADGRGVGSVLLRGRRQICVNVSVANIAAPTAAHIHAGVAGQNGAVVVTLGTPPQGGLAGSIACSQIAAALHLDLRRRPHRYYINVHNALYPNGAVRGQLFRTPAGS